MPEPDASDRTWPPLETAQSALIGLTALTAAIAPLAIPPMVVILAFVTLVQHRHDDWSLFAATPSMIRNPSALAVIAFVTLAAASTAWAAQPGYALKSLVQAVLTGLSAWYAANAMSRQLTMLGQARRNRFVRALPIAALFVAIYFLLDFLTGDGATLFVARNFPSIFDGFENTFIYDGNRSLVGLDESYFNRIAAALVLLTVGLLAAVRFWPRRTWGFALSVFVSLGMVGICLRSGSATALLSLAAAALAFACALWSPKPATRMLQAALLVVTLTAVPLSMLPKALNMDKNPALPPSFTERVIIWNDIAGMTLERPWLGIGVKSIRFLERWPPKPGSSMEARGGLRSYPHPHNGYLQVWLELGAVGAVIFAIAGVSLINGILSLPHDMQKYALALAAGTSAIIGPGWDIWQPWLVAAIGFSWIALMMLRAEFKRAEKNLPDVRSSMFS
ncbi:MAG: O-antigen ligase family protein [Hyphomicrobiaceae bacterium]